MKLNPETLNPIAYLSPKRYFRFYMLYLPEDKVTCWLPEGFMN